MKSFRFIANFLYFCSDLSTMMKPKTKTNNPKRRADRAGITITVVTINDHVLYLLTLTRRSRRSNKKYKKGKKY